MAIIMQNPDNVPGAVSTGYQLQNELLYAHIAGFTNVYFTPDYSYMRAGSIFEINGTLVKCQTDEEVLDLTTIANNNYFYIYAGLINTTTVKVTASVTEPVWDIGKCGFYDNNRRAIIKMARTMDGIFHRVGFDATIDSSRLILPSGPGTLIPEANLTGEAEIGLTLNTGWYRVVLKAGGGGGGTNNSTFGVGQKGQEGGSIGTLENVYFYVPYNGVKVKLISGSGGAGGTTHIDPNYGGAATHTKSTGGGASVLYIMELGLLYIAVGGNGANGVEAGEAGGTYNGFCEDNSYKGGYNNINSIIGGGGPGGAGGDPGMQQQSWSGQKGGDGSASIYKY